LIKLQFLKSSNLEKSLFQIFSVIILMHQQQVDH